MAFTTTKFKQLIECLEKDSIITRTADLPPVADRCTWYEIVTNDGFNYPLFGYQCFADGKTVKILFDGSPMDSFNCESIGECKTLLVTRYRSNATEAESVAAFVCAVEDFSYDEDLDRDPSCEIAPDSYDSLGLTPGYFGL